MLNWQGLSKQIEQEQRNNPQVFARCNHAVQALRESLQMLEGHGYNLKKLLRHAPSAALESQAATAAPPPTLAEALTPAGQKYFTQGAGDSAPSTNEESI